MDILALYFYILLNINLSIFYKKIDNLIIYTFNIFLMENMSSNIIFNEHLITPPYSSIYNTSIYRRPIRMRRRFDGILPEPLNLNNLFLESENHNDQVSDLPNMLQP